MSNFPSAFDQDLRLLTVADVGDPSVLAFLAERDYEVYSGLTPEAAADILAMSKEPNILETCPRDSGERFTDRAATEKWLAKKRAMFLLMKREGDGLKLAGYGWAGDATNEHLPAGRVTFAVRVGEIGQGQGLAAPFSQAVIFACAINYGAADFWLETWASNGAAVHIYHKIGFETVTEVAAERQSPSQGPVPDTRIYMSLDNSRLPKNDTALSSNS